MPEKRLIDIIVTLSCLDYYMKNVDLVFLISICVESGWIFQTYLS